MKALQEVADEGDLQNHRVRRLKLAPKERDQSAFFQQQPKRRLQKPLRRVHENCPHPAYDAHGWPFDVLCVDRTSEVQMMELFDCPGVSWLLVLPEYFLNVFSVRWGRGLFSGAQMASIHLGSGVVCVALIARFYLGEILSWPQLAGFVLMEIAIALILIKF